MLFQFFFFFHLTKSDERKHFKLAIAFEMKGKIEKSKQKQLMMGSQADAKGLIVEARMLKMFFEMKYAMFEKYNLKILQLKHF